MPNWKINNGDFYVAKSGSTDSRTTGDADHPFRTLQQALDAAQGISKSPVSIIVGAGLYTENLSYSGSHHLAILGDGKVLLQPGRTGGVLLNQTGGIFRLDLTHIQVQSSLSLLAGSQTQLGLYDCQVLSCRIDYNHRDSQFTRCTFDNSRIWATPRSTGFATFAKCTFLHSEVGGLGHSNEGLSAVVDCFFDDDSRITDADSRRISRIDFNNYRFATGRNLTGFEFEIDGTAHILLNSLQLQFPDWNENSMSLDPRFNAATFEDRTLTEDSPMAYKASDGYHIGAWETGFAYGAGSSPELDIRNLLLTGVEYSSGSFRLLSGVSEGTIETQAIDLQDRQTLGKVRLFATQTYPGEVIDSSNRVETPNRQTYEMRFGDDPRSMSNYLVFEWDEIPTYNTSGVITRAPVGNGEPAFDIRSATPVVAQYVQLRVTLRNNGIEA